MKIIDMEKKGWSSKDSIRAAPTQRLSGWYPYMITVYGLRSSAPSSPGFQGIFIRHSPQCVMITVSLFALRVTQQSEINKTSPMNPS